MNKKIVLAVSIIFVILFAVFFIKFFPPLESASNAVITKESRQTAVKTTHKRGAGIGRFSRMNHVAYVNDRDWVVLGPWTKDQNNWTAVQIALHNEETVEITYAAQSNIILDHIPIESWFADFPVFTGKVKARVWSSKTKQWNPQRIKLQTILQARHNSGDVFYVLEAKNAWINFLPLVFIALILFLNMTKRKFSRTV